MKDRHRLIEEGKISVELIESPHAGFTQRARLTSCIPDDATVEEAVPIMKAVLGSKWDNVVDELIATRDGLARDLRERGLPGDPLSCLRSADTWEPKGVAAGDQSPTQMTVQAALHLWALIRLIAPGKSALDVTREDLLVGLEADHRLLDVVDRSIRFSRLLEARWWKHKSVFGKRSVESLAIGKKAMEGNIAPSQTGQHSTRPATDRKHEMRKKVVELSLRLLSSSQQTWSRSDLARTLLRDATFKNFLTELKDSGLGRADQSAPGVGQRTLCRRIKEAIEKGALPRDRFR